MLIPLITCQKLLTFHFPPLFLVSAMAVSSVFSCCLLVLFSWRWLLRIIYIYIAVIDHKLCFLSSASHGIYSTTFFSFFLIFPPNCLRATLWSSITVRSAALLFFTLGKARLSLHSVLLDCLSSKGITMLNKVFSLDNDSKQICMALGKHS